MSYADKVKNNVRDRINTVPVLVTTPVDTVMTAGRELIALKPVKALTTIIRNAGNGVAQALDTNADITRRWF